MPDFLDRLARDAKETLAKGYYTSSKKETDRLVSLKLAIAQCRKTPVISEVKAASPSTGIIRENVEPEKLAHAMVRGGAVGVSVLTEPVHFNGSLENLRRVRQAVNVPVLMKDIIISPKQLVTASRIGANAVLLIQSIFDRGYCQQSLPQMINYAHASNLEVLLETHNADEFRRAVTSEADMVGINNRDLATLMVDLKITKRILKRNATNDKIVVSESGICEPADLLFLRECGAQAFLIGSAVMFANEVETKVREFVNA